MFKFKSPYFYSLVDLSQAEFLLSGLKKLFEKQNEENSKFQNKLGIKPVEYNGMISYCLIFLLTNHTTKLFFNCLITF